MFKMYVRMLLMSVKYYRDPRINASLLKLYAGDEVSIKKARTYKYPEKKHFKIGSAIHLGLEFQGKLPDTIKECPYGTFQTDAAKAWRDEEEAKGNVALNSKEYAKVEGAIKEAWEYRPETIEGIDLPTVYQSSNAVREEELYTEEFKAMLDLRVDGILIDWKTTRFEKPSDVERDFFRFNYPVQAYHYKMVAELCGIEYEKFYFVFVCKEPPYEVNVVEVTDDIIHIGEAHWTQAYLRYQKWRDVPISKLPGYSNKVLKPEVPQYLREPEPIFNKGEQENARIR